MTTANPVGLGGFFSLFDLPPTIYKTEALERLGTVMAQARVSASTRIPSSYVYLGQLIAHDITKLKKPDDQEGADAQKRAGVQKPPIAPGVEDLVQLRTPLLDLDCVYGTGFDDETVAVDKSSGEMKLGPAIGARSDARDDLPRRYGSPIAIIPDERNDENLLLAQLHVLFLKLHNFFVRKIRVENPRLTARQLFEQARSQVILHYQQVVMYDFLEVVCDPQVWEYVIGGDRGTFWDPVFAEAARMPVELSAAALRFGHSMVRSNYQLNWGKSANLGEIFEMTGQGGFRGKNGLPATHVVDWRFYFHGGDAGTAAFVNVGLTIDPIVHVRLPLPNDVFLAIKNLQTGNLSRLPDGQTLARHVRQTYPEMALALKLELLTPQQLDPEVSFRDENGEFREGRLLTEVGLNQGFTIKTPLWYYLLAEALAASGGQHLGVLGSLLLTDLMRALVRLSSPSVMLENFKSRYIVPTKHLKGRAYLTLKDLASTVASGLGPADAVFPNSTKEAIMIEESEEEIIDRFVGDYVADGKFDSPSLDKDPWFPPKDLKLQLFKVSLGNNQVGAKIRLELPPDKNFEGKAAIESATYRVKDGNLFAEKLPLRPDLTADETLEMVEQGMLHTVKFSDEVKEGRWTCPRPPPPPAPIPPSNS